MIFWKKKDKDNKTDAAPAPVDATEVVEETLPVVEETGAAVLAEDVQEEVSSKQGWLSRLTSGLSKSTQKLGQDLTDLVTKRKLDQETLDQLEEVLIAVDVGPQAAAKIVAGVAEGRFGKEISDEELRDVLAARIAPILEKVAMPLAIEKPETGPFVILVCGVNGVGKTTTIGKLAHQFRQDGRKVMIAAGDTFRAAAVEQLNIWAQRTGASFVARDIGADAAAVAFEAYEKAVQAGVDVLMIDTAGRLHNKSHLMAELEKVVRVLKKHGAAIPHATLLVLDATTGQNAHAQVEAFRDMVNISGLVVTKLDGSARGGVIVGLADRFGLPIHAVGVGEGVEDLQPFAPDAYARVLTGAQG